MIQLLRNQSVALTTNYGFISTVDVGTSDLAYYLMTIESIQSGNSKTFIISDIAIYGSRYVRLGIYVANSAGGEVLTDGKINIGDYDFPYGFYNYTLYQNNSAVNLDPANATKVLEVGLANLTSKNNDSVTYTEYTTNDSDTDAVYITNTI